MCLAVPGKIVSISGENEFRSAMVIFGGVLKRISLAFLPEAKVDDYVMVHVGFALSVVDESEARIVLGYLQEIGGSLEGKP